MGETEKAPCCGAFAGYAALFADLRKFGIDAGKGFAVNVGGLCAEAGDGVGGVVVGGGNGARHVAGFDVHGGEAADEGVARAGGITRGDVNRREVLFRAVLRQPERAAFAEGDDDVFDARIAQGGGGVF